MHLADKDLEEVLHFEPTRVLKSQISLFLAISKMLGIIESLIQFFQCQLCPSTSMSCAECSYQMCCLECLWQMHVAVIEQRFKRIETPKLKSV